MDRGVVGTPSRAALTMQEAAAALGVSRSHLYGLADRGELRLIRLGRRTLVPVSELDRLVEGHDQR